MITALVSMVRPLVVPLLKLKLAPPHLPEGQHLVRHLRPATQWLTVKYVLASFGLAWPLVVTTAATIGLTAKYEFGGLALSLLGWLAFSSLALFSLVSIRLDFELRHYLVGDRSLRVSQGILSRQEVTLTYANVQNVEVNQGPIARLLNIKSLTVSTAGGRVGPEGGGHQVTLEGLTDADGLRVLILDMMKQHKDSGLGGDDHHQQNDGGPLPLTALNEVREAAVALRNSIVS